MLKAFKLKCEQFIFISNMKSAVFVICLLLTCVTGDSDTHNILYQLCKSLLKPSRLQDTCEWNTGIIPLLLLLLLLITIFKMYVMNILLYNIPYPMITK